VLLLLLLLPRAAVKVTAASNRMYSWSKGTPQQDKARDDYTAVQPLNHTYQHTAPGTSKTEGIAPISQGGSAQAAAQHGHLTKYACQLTLSAKWPARRLDFQDFNRSLAQLQNITLHITSSKLLAAHLLSCLGNLCSCCLNCRNTIDYVSFVLFARGRHR
jgi:hypothetical protein